MATEVRTVQFEGHPAHILESNLAQVVVLSHISGKIASLVDKITGEELLWRNPDRRYREPVYGDAWTAYDMSGWEDCLPTVAPSPYPDGPWRGILLPEHGEVWALPWDARILDGSVEVATQGVRLPYRFEKRVSLESNQLRLHHRLTNLSPFPIRYIWATHPLFRVKPGMKIVLPSGVRVRIDWSRGSRLGQYLEELPWPAARDSQGRLAELDCIGESTLAQADKLYTSALAEGWCGLEDPSGGQAVALTFDPRRLPYVGIWINQGGWPLAGAPCYNVALEPTCGYPDLLYVACLRGAAPMLAPKHHEEWEVRLCFGQGTVRSLVSAV